MSLERDPDSIRGQEFDVLVVGGGAFGACAAWEAALRGYSVALVEAHDFGSGTSANSFKFVHGGIRYLQHLDFSRMWASCRERSALLRVAPHLVKPQAVAVPTYGHGRHGKAFLGAGFIAYHALTSGRNRGISDVSRRIPGTSFMSRDEILRRFDGLEARDLTGAAIFSDAQMYHPPRLVLAFVMSAVDRGAVALNYVEATSFIRQGNSIRGILARDRLTGEEFEIRSRVAVNAAGPWSEQLLLQRHALRIPDAGVYSRDTCFIIDGAPEPDYALAVPGLSIDKGAKIGRGARHLFVVPWRGRRLVGVWHIVYRNGPDSLEVSEEEIARLLDEFNQSLSSMRVKREDIRLVNAGLVPFGQSDDTGAQLKFGKCSHLVDSAAAHGLDGLVTLIGVRHTMARGEAVNAMDIVDRKLKRSGNTPDSATEPLIGGHIGDFEKLAGDVQDALTGADSQTLSRELAALYGSEALSVIERHRQTGCLGRIAASEIIGAQISEAVEGEMAQTLGDVVFRRTPLAAAGDPGADVLRACADAMGDRLNWPEQRRQRELEAVKARFPSPFQAGRISEERPGVAAATGDELDLACPER